MIKVFIFGGTTEGRELAQFCVRYQIPALVCVTSEYGSKMLPEHPCLTIHKGKLDEDQMVGVIKKYHPVMIMDATHPYAGIVSETVKKAAEKTGITCHRVLRRHDLLSEDNGEGGSRIVTVSDVASAVRYLEGTSGTVLLTTGSKTLKDFMAISGSRERIYARVLPDSKVIADCEQTGISGSHLICMQGPFSQEMNQAMIKQTGAAWLVTKESGAAGGFIEKAEAVKACGISMVVIGRPVEEQGISLTAAMKILVPYGIVPPRQLHLIGMGMGGGRQLTLEALDTMKACQVFLGAKRMLQDISGWTEGKPTVPVYQGEAVLSWIMEHPEYDSIGVIYSGDTGFYSGSHVLVKAVGDLAGSGGDIHLHVYPGISTAACLCARLKTPWDDAALASIHGRNADVPGLLKVHKKVFLLLGGKHPLQSLCKNLIDNGYEKIQVAAGERLGYPEERILTGTPGQLLETETDTLIAVLLERNVDGGGN